MNKWLIGVLFILIGLVSCKIETKARYQEWEIASIPTKNQVGVNKLPDEIAPVQAPFKTIDFKKPIVLKDTMVLSLSPNGINTQKIQNIINQLSLKGGGVVVVPNGIWLTGRIELKSNINLHFENNATLKFSGEVKDYLPAVFTRIEGVEVMSLGACIYANQAKNIAITGNGVLIGPAEGAIRERTIEAINIETVIDIQKPVAGRVIDGSSTSWVFPPMLVSPINCENVYIESISLKNSAFWNIVPIYCENVIIRGVTINSVGIPRGDGIDIESSKNVLIEYCTLSTGDDSFTMKAGRGKDGIRVNRPTKNIVVRYCLTKEGHGGVTCGSETAGMISNLYVHDCVFLDTTYGLRFKTRRTRGGGGENLTFERIRLNAKKAAVKWDMLGSTYWVGELAERFPTRAINTLTPYYRNIHLKDIIVENTRAFISLIGIPETPVFNLTIENAIVNCEQLIYAQDLENAQFKNLKVTSSKGILQFDEAKNVHFKNVEFNTKTKVRLKVKGNISQDISIKASKGIKDTIWVRK